MSIQGITSEECSPKVIEEIRKFLVPGFSFLQRLVFTPVRNHTLFAAIDALVENNPKTVINSMNTDIWKTFIKNIDVDRDLDLTNISTIQSLAVTFIEYRVESIYISFEALTAAILKLNMYNESINTATRDALLKYFKSARSEFVKKLDKDKSSINIYNYFWSQKDWESYLDINWNDSFYKDWSDSLATKVFEGKKYTELDTASKIICISSDFVKINRGKWTSSKISFLKSAMTNIGINPEDKLVYGDILSKLLANDKLLQKLFDLDKPLVINYPEPSTMLVYLYKKNLLDGKEPYIVDSIVEMMESNNVKADRVAIAENLLKKYMYNEVHVDLDKAVEAFDVVVDLLYEVTQIKKH